MTQIPQAYGPREHITVRFETSSNKKHNLALAFAVGTAVGALLIAYSRNWFSGPALLLSDPDAPTHVVKSYDEMGNRVLKRETCPRDQEGFYACSAARAEVYKPFTALGERYFFVRQCEPVENGIFDCPDGELDIPTQWVLRDGICSREPCSIDPFEDTPVLGQCLKDECSPQKRQI